MRSYARFRLAGLREPKPMTTSASHVLFYFDFPTETCELLGSLWGGTETDPWHLVSEHQTLPLLNPKSLKPGPISGPCWFRGGIGHTTGFFQGRVHFRLSSVGVSCLPFQSLAFRAVRICDFVTSNSRPCSEFFKGGCFWTSMSCSFRELFGGFL